MVPPVQSDATEQKKHHFPEQGNSPGKSRKLSSSKNGIIHLQVSRWLAIGLVVLFIVPWVSLFFYLLNSPKKISVSSMTSSDAPPKTGTGPWGDLEYKVIYLEPPEEFIPVQQFSQDQLKWTLKNYTHAKLKELFESANLNADQMKSILENSKEEGSINGFVLFPQDSLIIGLTPEQRAVIYKALSEFEENFYQYYPTCVSTELFSSTSKFIDEKTEEHVRKLQYRRGNAILFSDFDILRKLVPSDEEFINVLEALCRKRTIFMRLRVNPQSDINSLARYWGRGGREKTIYPILEGFSESTEGSLISVLTLLPPFARVRAFTYPLPTDNPVAAREDCFWTCMNFFNEVPDSRFTDPAYVKEVLTRDYFPIETRPLLGDLVFLVKPSGDTVHAAVYIADGIVFTKNGPTSITPWTFMTISDLVVNYPSNQKLQVRTYRHKNITSEN